MSTGKYYSKPILSSGKDQIFSGTKIRSEFCRWYQANRDVCVRNTAVHVVYSAIQIGLDKDLTRKASLETSEGPKLFSAQRNC